MGITHWTREMWTKDLVFEVLIRAYMGANKDGAMRDILGRAPEYEDIKAFDEKVTLMYNGWVTVNMNIRRLKPRN